MTALRRNLARSHKTLEITFGPAKLFLDDVDDIMTFLTEFANKGKPRQLALDGAVGTNQENGVTEGLENALEDLYRVELQAGDAVADDVEDLRHASNDELKSVQISMTGLSTWFVSVAISQKPMP